MDEIEKTVFQNNHEFLINNIYLQDVAPFLHQRQILTEIDYQEILNTDKLKISRCALLLERVKDRSSMGTFLECMEKNKHEFISEKICNELKRYKESGSKQQVIPISPAKQSFVENEKLLKFSERLKVRIHESVFKKHFCEIRQLTSDILITLNDTNSIKQKRRLADFVFILLDSIAIMERTHNKNKEILWKSDVYKKMEGLISQTSHTDLTRIRYNARFGVALTLSADLDNYRRGIELVQIALEDSLRYHVPRDSGNCMFALANIKLNWHKHNKCKEDILKLIEIGIQYFVNEVDELRTIWRRVYLIKKAACHLGLDNTAGSSLDSNATDNDVRMAGKCLRELETQMDEMDSRRQVQFYRAQSHFYLIKNRPNVARGYLQEAREVCRKSDLQSELAAVEKSLRENARAREIFQSGLHKKPDTESAMKCTMTILHNRNGSDFNENEIKTVTGNSEFCILNTVADVSETNLTEVDIGFSETDYYNRLFLTSTCVHADDAIENCMSFISNILSL